MGAGGRRALAIDRELDEFDRAFYAGLPALLRSLESHFQRSHVRPHRQAYDFRMNTVAVYFYGATLKSDTNADQANGASAITADGDAASVRSHGDKFGFHILSHGTFRYRYPPKKTSTNFVETDFQFARSTSAFNYIYNPADRTYSPESV
ncbi:MAG: hypothetical protein J3Q66DRAFT_371797 [Benniella sp.]|nr:MAG: hypothetical protein J3Q66DRAFT_371797 [Benniella sp.]